jgi:3-deoxy-manno-octulosonate cytidylyltransferase (CMP-KDO synthetase)
MIPARMGSTRFPGKALAPLCGKPIIQHVYEAATRTALFDEVLVATDSSSIIDAVNSFGGKAVMTSQSHQSGSDRIAEAITGYPADVIVNIQGDEPLIDKHSLQQIVSAFDDDTVEVASLYTSIDEIEMLIDSNIVKVVLDSDSNAIYFSRAPIPYNRDNIPGVNYHRHIGVYAYRQETLLRFVNLPMGVLEQIEKLEQLRMLEHGIRIRMIPTLYQGIGIDTPQDLLLVESILQGKLS